MLNLSPDDRGKIHAAYVAIFNLPFNIQRKTNLLAWLMGGIDWAWRVTGITVGALEVLESNKYKKAKGMICRAHKIDRIVTARAVFDTSQPLNEDRFFTLIWENDETVIATKSENRAGGTLPEKIIPIDYKLGMFRNANVGFEYSIKKEADFLRKLHADYKSQVAK